MAKKLDRIDVLTVGLKLHIPVDSGNAQSVETAADQAKALHELAKTYTAMIVFTTVYERIVAPEAAGDTEPKDERPLKLSGSSP